MLDFQRMVSVYGRLSLRSSLLVQSGWHLSPISLEYGNKEHSTPPLDGTLVHCRAVPPTFTGQYTSSTDSGRERGTITVECLVVQ